MLKPVGPLPPSVYWRRRAVTVLAAVSAVVALVWLSVTVVGGGSSEPAAQQSPLTSTSTSTTADEPAPATSTSAEVTTAPSGANGPGLATVPLVETTPVETTPVETTPEPTTPPPPAPAPVPTCEDAAVGVTAQVAQPQYVVGEQPVFRLVITNTTAATCTRDLDASLQQVLVFSADGASRLWSSNDCFPGNSDEVATLDPGAEKVYSVQWAGTTSEPGCTAPRNPVLAGQYTVVVGLGPLMSQPVPFTLV